MDIPGREVAALAADKAHRPFKALIDIELG